MVYMAVNSRNGAAKKGPKLVSDRSRMKIFEIFQNLTHSNTGRLTGNLFSRIRSISIKTYQKVEKVKTKTVA